MSRVSRLVTSFLLAAAAFTFAAGQFSSVAAQTDNKATATAWIAAINAAFKSGDATAVLAFYSPDYTSDSGSTGADALASLKTSMTGLAAAFPDGKIDIKDMVAEGDKVAVYTVLSGTNTGPMGAGMGPTGKAISNVKQVDFLTFKNGKIVSDNTISDTGSLYIQLGFNITPPTVATSAATAPAK